MIKNAVKNIIYGSWRWMCNQNYKHELFSFKKEFYGREFYMYDPPLPYLFFSDILLEILLSHVQSGDNVYDVGAARGEYTLSLAVSECSVYSFEPNPSTYSSLLKNIRLNKLSNVHCFNIGLSDSSGTLTFYITNKPLRSSFRRDMLESKNEKIIKTEKVTVNSIDKLVHESIVPPPDHIKVDVEGYEFEVLKGAEKTILKYHPKIFFEPHYFNDRLINIDIKNKYIDYFKTIDYRVIEFGNSWVCMPIH